MRNRRLQLLSVGLLLAAPAAGHDIWLQADAFRLEPGEALVVRQLLGEELAADLAATVESRELPLLLDMTPSFRLVTRGGEIDLLDGAASRASLRPVVERRVEEPGLALVTMSHSVLYTETTRAEFLEILEHEELDPAAFREHMGSVELQTEGYLRTLKSLVLVGPPEPDDDLHARVVGQEIELVLLQNPYLLDPGDELGVRVLLRGQPLPGQRVKAYVAGGGEATSRKEARTGADGVARFAVERAGVWLLRAVRLAPCGELSSVDCDGTLWESYWSAFSFEID